MKKTKKPDPRQIDLEEWLRDRQLAWKAVSESYTVTPNKKEPVT